MSEAVLAADLAEFAGPIRKDTGKTRVGEVAIGGVAAAVKAPAHGPAAIDTIFSRRVHSEGVRSLENAECRQLVAGAPEEFRAEQEILVNGAPQRLPAQGRIGSVK